MKNLPPLKSLVFFDQVAQTRHFAKAAKKLNVTPGAVSQQIKLLEQFLGCQLLLRNTKTVALSNQGENYFNSIHPALSAIALATNRIRPEQHGMIQIKLMATLALEWLIPRLSDFYIHHPNISINLMTSSDADSYSDDRSVDFSIRPAKHKPDERAQKLWQDALVLVYNKAFFAEAELENATQIIVNHRFRKEDWNYYARQSGFVPGEKQLQLTSTAQAVQATLNGLGVFVTHLPLIYHLIETGKLTVYGPSVKSAEAYYLIEGNDLNQSLAKARTKAWLLQQAAEYL